MRTLPLWFVGSYSLQCSSQLYKNWRTEYAMRVEIDLALDCGVGVVCAPHPSLVPTLHILSIMARNRTKGETLPSHW